RARAVCICDHKRQSHHQFPRKSRTVRIANKAMRPTKGSREDFSSLTPEGKKDGGHGGATPAAKCALRGRLAPPCLAYGPRRVAAPACFLARAHISDNRKPLIRPRFTRDSVITVCMR